MLNWSSTLRRIGARTIVLYWGFIVTAEFICVFVTIFGYIRYMNSGYSTTYTIWYEDTLWWPDDFAFLRLGDTPNVSQVLNCAPSSKLNSTGPYLVTPQFIVDYGCQNPCGSFHDMSVFRTDSELQLLTDDQSNVVLDTGTVKEMKTKYFVFGYQTYGMIILPYILVQGFWAALNGRRSPAQVRDNFYIFVSGLTLWKRGTKRKNSETPDRLERKPRLGFSSLQKPVAKYWALLVYAWAISITLICPPLFILNLVASELSLSQLIEAEPPTGIGQWSPWASTALILLAALIGQYHDRAVSSLVAAVRYALWKLRGKLTKSQPSTWTYLVENETARGAKQGSKHHLRHIMAPFKTTLKKVQDECLNAKGFWEDPDTVARYSLRQPIHHGSGSSALVAQIHSNAFPIDIMGMEIQTIPKVKTSRRKEGADYWEDRRRLPRAHLNQELPPGDNTHHAMQSDHFTESLPQTASLYEHDESPMQDEVMMAADHGQSATDSLLSQNP